MEQQFGAGLYRNMMDTEIKTKGELCCQAKRKLALHDGQSKTVASTETRARTRPENMSSNATATKQ